MIPEITRYFRRILTLLIILSVACPALAREVTVKGVGVAPITKGKESSAKRVALQLAKRDAVERALGAEVQAEAIPAQELTRVSATSSATLKFTVLHEGAQGNVYITEIEAALPNL